MYATGLQFSQQPSKTGNYSQARQVDTLFQKGNNASFDSDFFREVSSIFAFNLGHIFISNTSSKNAR